MQKTIHLGKSKLPNAVLINNSEGYYAGGTVNTSPNIKSQTDIITFTAGADITLTLAEWKKENGTVRLYNAITTERKEQLRPNSNAGAGTLKKLALGPRSRKYSNY